MKKKLFVSLFFVGGLLGILLCVPYFISFDKMKPTLEEKFYEASGYCLNLKGPLHLRLLPFPQVTLKDIEVTDVPNSEKQEDSRERKVLIKAEAISAQLALSELLVGKLSVHKIQIEKPILYVENFTSVSNRPKPAPSGLVPQTEERQASPSDSSSFQIRTINFTDAQIVLDQKTDQKISHLHFDLYPQKSSGAWVRLAFSGNGSYRDTPLALKGALNLKDNNYDVSADLSAKDHEIHFDGQLSLAPVLLKGTITSNGSFEPQTLEAFFSNNVKENLAYELKGNLSCSPESLEMSEMTLKCDPYTLSGNGSVVFGSRKVDVYMTASDALHKDTAVSLQLSSILSPELNGYPPIHFQLRGENTQSLFQVFQRLPQGFGQSLSCEGLLNIETSRISAEGFSFHLDDLAIQGAFSYVLDPKNPSFTYDLTFLNMKTLDNFLGGLDLTSFFGSSCRIKGQSFLLFPQIKTKTILSGPFLTLQVEGSFDFSSGKVTSVLTLLSVSPQSFLSDFFGKEPFEAIKIQGTPQNLELDFSSTTQKGLSGKILAQLTDPMTKIKGALTFNEIVLKSQEREPDQPPVSRSRKPSASGHRSQKAQQGDSLPSFCQLQFFKNLEVDVALKVNHLFWGKIDLKNIQTHLKVDDNVLTLSSVTAQVFDGNFLGMASLSFAPTLPVLSISAQLTEANAQRLPLLASDHFSLQAGVLSGSVQLAARGCCIHDFLHSVSGKLVLEIKNGVVNGVDLNKAVRSLRAADTLSGILSLLNASFSKGQSQFSEGVLHLEFNKGLGVITDGHLLADGADVRAQGSIQLDPAQCQVGGDIVLHLPHIPSIGFKIYGPFENLKASLDTNKLESYITSQILPSLFGSLGKDGKKIINAAAQIIPDLTAAKPSDHKNPSKGSSKNGGENPVENLVQSGLDLLGL